MDEHERAYIALRANGIIRATAAQAQQLIKEYADSQIATVAGLVSLWERAVVTLEMLSEERNRLLGQACVTDASKQFGSARVFIQQRSASTPMATDVRIRVDAAEPPTTPADPRRHVPACQVRVMKGTT